MRPRAGLKASGCQSMAPSRLGMIGPTSGPPDCRDHLRVHSRTARLWIEPEGPVDAGHDRVAVEKPAVGAVERVEEAVLVVMKERLHGAAIRRGRRRRARACSPRRSPSSRGACTGSPIESCRCRRRWRSSTRSTCCRLPARGSSTARRCRCSSRRGRAPGRRRPWSTSDRRRSSRCLPARFRCPGSPGPGIV